MQRRIGFTLATILMLSAITFSQGAVKVQKSKPKPKPAVTKPAVTKPIKTDKPVDVGALVAPIKPAKIHTMKDFLEQFRGYYHRTFVEGYGQYGSHDAKWDDKAVAILQAYIKYMMRDADALKSEVLAARAQEVIDLGCTDPLVRSVCGLAFGANYESSKSVSVLDTALDDLVKSKYPKWWSCWTAKLLSDGKTAGTAIPAPRYDQIKELMKTQALIALKDGSFGPGEERIMLCDFDNCFNKRSHPYVVEEVMKLSSADTYLHKIIEGRKEIEEAWKDRGHGWAYQVTETQWQAMHEHLAVARKLLVEAWKQHPDFPEAPTMMIGVAMADTGPENGTPREWFDRAVEAQFDWQAAYDSYRISILPRWGGSSDEMYAFGVRCLETGRFDTEVTWGFFRALHDITNDLNGDKKYWLKPETSERLETLYDGCAKAHPEIPNHFRTLKAITAWYVGDYRKAKVLLDELGDNYSKQAFESNFNVQYDFVRNDTDMRASTFGVDLARLDKMADSGKYSEALALAETLNVKAVGNKLTMEYVDRCLPRMRVLSAFVNGQWAALQPGKSFAGWKTGKSHWEAAPNGTFVAVPPDGSGPVPILLSDMDFGKRLEIKGEIEFVSEKTGRRNAGVVFKHPSAFITVLFNRDTDNMTISELGNKDFVSVPKAGLADKNTFLVQHWEDEITVYLNGKLLKERVLADPFTAETLEVGLISLYGNGNETVKFRKLQIHKLSKQP